MLTKKLSDGQTIYCLGTVNMGDFYMYLMENEFDRELNHLIYKNYKNYSLTLDHLQKEFNNMMSVKYAIRRLIKNEKLDLYNWLRKQNIEAVLWIDPEICNTYMFDPGISRFMAPYEHYYGIGFKQNDRLETMFVLRWT